MTRTKSSSKNKYKHKNLLKLNKGFRGGLSKLIRTAKQKNKKSLQYTYRNRKIKKRSYKKTWIKQINGSIRTKKYNSIINEIKIKKITINKKIITKLIQNDYNTFLSLQQ